MELKDLTVGKQGYLVQLTDEQLMDVLPFTVLSMDEQEAARDKARQENLTYCARVDVQLLAAHPALQPVIAHHSHDEDGRYCKGCDEGDYAETSPEWPCSTIELILEGLGPHMAPAASCPTRLMDGRNELRCWLTAGHEGDCK